MESLTDAQALAHWQTYQAHAGSGWSAECSQRAPCDRREAARQALIEAGLLARGPLAVTATVAWVEPLPPPEVRQHIATAIAHHPAGYEDLCVECGWHHPCPAYFRARLALEVANVPPVFWAW